MDCRAGWIRQLVPPVVVDFVNGLRQRRFVGDYPAWEEALRDSSADYGELLEAAKNAQLRVRNGEAEFERDSVLFYEPQYNWPLLAILQKAALCNGGALGVLDFGGSLGTVYYQNRKFLSGLGKLRWCILEQPSFVAVGRELFQNEELNFYSELDDCLANTDINLILISGVLQYLRNPFDMLDKLLSASVEWVVIDRTPFLLSEIGRDLLTVQRLPKEMHGASFPHWFFDKKKFMRFLQGKGYALQCEFEAYGCDRPNIRNSAYSGLILQRKPKS